MPKQDPKDHERNEKEKTESARLEEIATLCVSYKGEMI